MTIKTVLQACCFEDRKEKQCIFSHSITHSKLHVKVEEEISENDDIKTVNKFPLFKYIYIFTIIFVVVTFFFFPFRVIFHSEFPLFPIFSLFFPDLPCFPLTSKLQIELF